MKVIFRFFLFILCLGGFFGTLAMAAVLGVTYQYSQDLPDLESLKDYHPPVLSEVFASDGTKIGEFWIQKRIILDPDDLPEVVIQSFLAAEDDRFFEHEGIDYAGILRALYKNILAGGIKEGGSTITQQVAKNMLLTSKRDVTRKIKEIILATKIERNFKKKEILYLYLNQIFFENYAYGIEAAARNYFHKSAKELNIAEAAMLASIPKAPSDLTPFKDPKGAKQRQSYVIRRMIELGFITEDQANAAKKFPLQIFKAEVDKDYNNKFTPWFTEHIRRELQKKYGNDAPYTMGLKIYTTVDINHQKAAEKAVWRGLQELDRRRGYRGPVKQLTPSEINPFAKSYHLQKVKVSLLSTWNYFDPLPEEKLLSIPTPLNKDDFFDAIVTSYDPKTQNLEILVGNIRGYIKSADYKWANKRIAPDTKKFAPYFVSDPKKNFKTGDVIAVKYTEIGKDGLNYFSLQQIPDVEGSLFSFEPQTGFVRAIVGGKDFKKSEYNRAIQSTRQTGSSFKPLLYAAALDKGYTTDSTIVDSPVYYEYSPGKFWSPKNYGGKTTNSPVSFRSALVNSMNIIAVKILIDVGLDYTVAYARKLGITTPIVKVYAMALGANDMKLVEMTTAFGTFPNGGILPKLVYITKMTDRYGKVLEEYQPTKVTPFQEQAQANKNKTKEEKEKFPYNTKVQESVESWIEKDKMQLTEVEKKILYGNYIPEGYTVSPRTAFTMVKLMNDIVNFGTGVKVKELNRPAAGKTGTTNDETDAWFVGFVPDLACGVWVGFDELKRLGPSETGGHTAAPIFLYYMQEALKDKPVAQFNIPKEINDAALKAPIDFTAGDPEAGGMSDAPGGGGGGNDFFIYDF